MCGETGAARCVYRYRRQRLSRAGIDEVHASAFLSRVGGLAAVHLPGRDRVSGETAGVARCHGRTSPWGPCVRSWFCPVGPGWPIDLVRWNGDNRTEDRRIRRCACRYGEATASRCWGDRSGVTAPVESAGPAVRSTREADIFPLVAHPPDK